MKDYKNKFINLLTSRRQTVYLIFVIGIAIIYISLAAAAAWTKSPWCDEAWFASPAFNLSTREFMGTTILEPSGTWLEGIDKYTYWIPPMYILAQTVWYEFFGFSLLSMRMMSVAFGLTALFSWFIFLKAISGEVKVALLGFALIAFDYCFIMTASVGRMDMMSAALSSAAFAAFMYLREKNFTRAIFVSSILTAINVFTHPTGVLAFVGLIFLVLYFDWKRVKWWHFAVAAIPFLIGAGLWGIYILKAPSLFLSQFGGNVNGINRTERLAGIYSLWASFKNEFTVRYLEFYGFGSDASGPARLKLFILLAYVAGIIAAVLTPGIRNHKGYRGLLLLTLLYFSMLLLLDGHKQVMYLVHIIPMFAAILAVSAHWYFAHRIISRRLLSIFIFGLILLQLGGVFYIIKQNDYRKNYHPAIEFLESYPDIKSHLIMGSGELGFGLEFPDNLIDDWRLGFHSGKKPDLIVVGKQYEGMFHGLRTSEPEVYKHVTELLNQEYRQIYDHGSIKIFRRKTLSSQNLNGSVE